MPREFSRPQRLGDQLQKELAVLLQREVRDPRVSMLSVNAVKVSKDLGYADVYYSVIGTEELAEDSPKVQEIQKVLKGASGFLRTQLGARVKTRIVPHLRFHFDAAVIQGRHLSSLIDRARNEDNSRAIQRGDDSDVDEQG